MNLPAPDLMKSIFSFIVVCVTVVVAKSQEIPPEDWWGELKGIKDGVIVKGSKSPNGKYALFEYHFRPPDETKSRIGLAPIDRAKLLYNIDSATKWMTDREVITFLSVLWNQNSDLLATHSSLARHSELRLYRLRETKAFGLKIPDLLKIAQVKHGLSRSDIRFSGQVPKKWHRRDLLEVAVTLKTKSRRFTTPVLLLIGSDGIVSVKRKGE